VVRADRYGPQHDVMGRPHPDEPRSLQQPLLVAVALDVIELNDMVSRDARSMT